MIAQVAAMVLELMGPPRDPAKAYRLAPVVSIEARRAGFDARLVTSIAFSESSFDESAVGDLGEIGLMQVLPTGEATFLCRGLRLKRLDHNVRCALRILARARSKCGPDPSQYVSRYSGRGCGPSSYSRRILGRLSRWSGS